MDRQREKSGRRMGYWRGMSYPFRGMVHVYLRHPGLARYWIIPIFLTLVALGVAAVGSIIFHGAIFALVWPQPVDAMDHLTYIAISFVFMIVVFLAGVVVVVMLSSLLAAPFNDRISRRVEEQATGLGTRVLSRPGFFGGTARSIAFASAKLLIYSVSMAPLLYPSLFIPVIGSLICSILALFLTTIYLAVDYTDWPATRRGKGLIDRARMIGRNFWAMFGFGSGVWLFLLVPFLNLLFMPAAVAGGTLLYLELEKREEAS